MTNVNSGNKPLSVSSPAEFGRVLKEETIGTSSEVRDKITAQIKTLQGASEAAPSQTQPQSLIGKIFKKLGTSNTKASTRVQVKDYKKFSKRIESLEKQLQKTDNADLKKIDALVGKMQSEFQKFENSEFMKVKKEDTPASTYAEELTGKKLNFSGRITAQSNANSTVLDSQIRKITQELPVFRQGYDIAKFKGVEASLLKKINNLEKDLKKLSTKSSIDTYQPYKKIEKELDKIDKELKKKAAFDNSTPAMENVSQSIEALSKLTGSAGCQLQCLKAREFIDKLKKQPSVQMYEQTSERNQEKAGIRYQITLGQAAQLVEIEASLKQLEEIMNNNNIGKLPELKEIDSLEPGKEGRLSERRSSEQLSAKKVFKKINDQRAELQKERESIQKDWNKAKSPEEFQKIRDRGKAWELKCEEFNKSLDINSLSKVSGIWERLFKGLDGAKKSANLAVYARDDALVRENRVVYVFDTKSTNFIKHISDEIDRFASTDLKAYTARINWLDYACSKDFYNEWIEAENAYRTKELEDYAAPEETLWKDELLAALYKNLTAAKDEHGIKSAWDTYLKDLQDQTNQHFPSTSEY